MTMIDKYVMEEIYNEIKTPYKYGAVLKCDDYFTDSPVVFRRGDKWFMSLVRIDKQLKTGYHTLLCESDDLIHWSEVGRVLGKCGEWDSAQSGGYAQFIDCEFGGSSEISTVDGKYAFAYIGGSANGYETDPLSIGMSFADELTDADSYKRLPSPVLAPYDDDARRGETLTLYKPAMFEDKARTTGHRYVCAYNAKDKTNRESIFLAVSDDGEKWQRYGENAVIPVWECADDVLINGDPQIITLNGHYVMLYFVCDKDGAHDTFAVSDDLIHWTKWDGEPLVKPVEEWENRFAHKPWVVKHNGVVYHFYCAVNESWDRFIALAASKEL